MVDLTNHNDVHHTIHGEHAKSSRVVLKLTYRVRWKICRLSLSSSYFGIGNGPGKPPKFEDLVQKPRGSEYFGDIHR